MITERMESPCGCQTDTVYLPVMAFIQVQNLEAVFEAEQALRCGTLFPELNKPFKGGCRHG